jgi:lipopolysaccharide export LptBFGC system permease protein LptF
MGGLWNFLKISFHVIMPSVLTISPIILFITTIIVYEKMLTNRELIILKCSGLTNYQLSKPVIILSFVIMLFSYIISLYIVPNSHYNIQKIKNNIFANASLSLIKDNKFINFQNITIYVDKKENNQLTNIILYNAEKNFLAQSERAIASSNGNIKLFNGTIQQTNKEQKAPFIIFFKEYTVNINDIMEKKDNSVTERIYNMPTSKLLNIFLKRSATKFSSLDILKEVSIRLLYPLLCVVISLLSYTLVISSKFNRISNVKLLATAISISAVVYAAMYLLLLKIDSGILFFCAFLFLLILTVASSIVNLIK